MRLADYRGGGGLVRFHCTCMYVRMYVCTCMYVCMYMYICMYMYASTQEYVGM